MALKGPIYRVIWSIYRVILNHREMIVWHGIGNLLQHEFGTNVCMSVKHRFIVFPFDALASTTDYQLCQVGRALVLVREALLILEDENAFGPHPGRDLERLRDQLRVATQSLARLERSEPNEPLTRKLGLYRLKRTNGATFRSVSRTTAISPTESTKQLLVELGLLPQPPESSSE